MMDFKPVAAILSGIGMMVAGVYCLDAAPEHSDATIASGPASLSAIPAAEAAVPEGISTAVKSRSPDSGARRVMRVELEVRQGRPVLVPELIPVPAGSPVAFTIESDTYDRFEIPGYGVSVDVAPGQPGRIAFDAVKPGRYPLQLASNGAVLGGLEVVVP